MGAVSSGIGDAGLFGPAGPTQQNYVPTQATRDNPNVSIGFGMPPPQEYTGDSISIQGNQPAPSPLPTDGMGGGKSMGGIGNLVGGALGTGGQMLNQFGLPQVGNALGQVGGVAQQIFPNQQPTQQNYVPTQATRTNPNVSIGFGMPAGGGIYGRDLSGNPNTQQLMGGMGTGTIAPPVNRFAPPNAPGVRSAQRTMRPNTRTRLR
jgi:hypothetical protein